jgi:hypothetical protein
MKRVIDDRSPVLARPVTALALRISSSSGLPVLPAQAAPCVLDLLGQRRHWAHVDSEAVI